MRGRIPSHLASVSALWLGAAACAQVLDLPDHPRLREAVAAPPRAARVPARDPEFTEVLDAGQAAPRADATAGTGQDPLAAPRLDASIQSLPRTPSEGSTAAETPDAGLDGLNPAPPDAAAPPPLVDATPAVVCAGSGVPGPHGRCYATLATELSWLAARESCRALGAGWELASVRSAEVNQFLTELLSSESWIGATDLSAEGTWLWIDDETLFWDGNAAGNPIDGAFVNWGGSEPNGGDTSNCARLVPGNSGVWADFECAELLSAVCAGPPG